MESLGLYPTWLAPGIGSGWIVGIIATIHVLFSHTSVGAAIFFAWLTSYANRHGKPEYLEFVRRYGMFLLVFSYVLGSITGPGIWFSTTAANPRGISALIHNFVWMWATEWVFFLIEVTGVYLLTYMATKVDRATHLRMTLIFGLAAYTTMLVIIGILSFMLWPGQSAWFAEGGYRLAFFGANTFAHLAMRTAFMFTMTALVGGIVACRFEDLAFREAVSRKLAWLGLVATVTGALLFFWYLRTLPESAQVVIDNRLPGYFRPALLSALGGMVAYFGAILLRPRFLNPGIAWAATVGILILGLWPEEVARESIRKPYIAGQYIYSNQVIARDVPGLGIRSELPLLEARGFLQTHPFAPANLRTLHPGNLHEAGRFLALTACSNCHTLEHTGMRPLGNFFGGNRDVPTLASYLQATVSTGHILYMPRIPLNDGEATALATFIASLAEPHPSAPSAKLSAPDLGGAR